MKSLSSVGPGDWPTLSARAHPNAVALRTPDGITVSYSELEFRSSRVARAWRDAGVVAGDRVALLGTDSIDYAVALFASLKLGTVAVPLNFRLSAAELVALIGLADPAVLVLESRYEHVLDQARAAVPALQTVSLDGSARCATTVADLVGPMPDGGWVRGCADVGLPAATSDDDTLLWMLTSGTTGRPRVVAQSQRMIKANSVKGVLEQGFDPGECLYAGTPLFHVAGMGWLFYAVSRGACALLLPQFDAAVLAAALASGVVQRCLLVPSMISALLAQPGVADRAYPRLRSIAYGGAATPPALVRRLHEVFGCDLYNTFGAGTEGGGQTILRPADHRAALAGKPHLLGSIGRPMYGVDLRLCDPEGREVATGEVGEICTRSDTVMSGYVGRADLTAERVQDGWIRGGDLARRDEEGYLYLVGRRDDMIVRGGENIFPAEVENVLGEHPAVGQVAVLGVADDYWGQVVAAAVVPADQFTDPVDAAVLQAFCRGRLASYKVPTQLVVLGELPRNAAGKVARGELRTLLAGLRPVPGR